MIPTLSLPLRLSSWTGAVLLFFALGILPAAGQSVEGRVVDDEGRTLTGVNVRVQDSFLGTTTDADGRFSLTLNFESGPQTLIFSFVGYETTQRTVSEPRSNLEVVMPTAVFQGDEVIVSASRTDERILETPVTVEKVSALQLERNPGTELLSSLQSLKGIDVSRSSMIISSLSTRGFNSAKSERLIQLVDYVDYVSPTLSIYPGNVAGPPQIDIESVDVIYGANSALYGANAFNGVVLMNTKSPFTHQGITVDVRGGSREMLDVSGRFAQKLNDRIALKVVGRYMAADEFIARSTVAQPQDVVPGNNTAGDPRNYDALNRYGEVNMSQNGSLAPVLANFGVDVTDNNVYTPGFTEGALAPRDFRAGMWQISPNLEVLLTDEIKAAYTFRWAEGDGIYQSSNRYLFDNFSMNLHAVEFLGPQWTVRAYRSDDGPGDTYDLNLLGSFMNQQPYQTGANPSNTEQALLAMGAIQEGNVPYVGAYAAVYGAAYQQARGQGLSESEAFAVAQQQAASVYPQGGEDRFNAARTATLGLPATAASPTFETDSQIYHVEGQYDLTLPGDVDASVGASYRRFRLTSAGTLFADGENASPLNADGTSRNVRDGITNEEAGGYVRLQRAFANERLKLSSVTRVDAFQNFDTRVSPRISGVYSFGADRQHNLRASVAQAYRSPAQLDQYIYLDIGPILLKGNVADGYNALDPFSATPLPQQLANGEQFQIAPLELEKMTSFEVGYKAVLLDRVYADVSYYRSWYTDFIGTRRFVGKEDGSVIQAADFARSSDDPLRARLMQVWLNADENVTTQGVQLSLQVPIIDALTIRGNYTWSDISEEEAALKERINLGFNTPTHKFNVGLEGEPLRNVTYSTNLRWVDDYLYEMPFSEGLIESHVTLDAQVGYRITPISTTVRLGGTNLTDADNVTAFGAAPMGRMLYAGFTVKY